MDGFAGKTFLRWVVASALLLACAACARAGEVYKCIDASGSIAFQDRPCAHGSSETKITIEPSPHAPVAAAPEHSKATATASRPSSRTRRAARAQRSSHTRDEPVSWECRVANGEVFYRHSPCPKAVNAAARSTRAAHQRGRSRVGAMNVVAHPVARAQACREINAITAGDRLGQERDERISTYERNLGRDPCRRY